MVARWLDFRATVMRPTHERPWLVLSPWASPKKAVSPSRPEDPISEQGFEELLGRVGPWEYHRFRHTCATEWLRAGMDLQDLSKLLGHASIQQTLCYAEIVRDDIARSMRKVESGFSTATGPKAPA